MSLHTARAGTFSVEYRTKGGNAMQVDHRIVTSEITTRDKSLRRSSTANLGTFQKTELLLVTMKSDNSRRLPDSRLKQVVQCENTRLYAIPVQTWSVLPLRLSVITHDRASTEEFHVPHASSIIAIPRGYSDLRVLLLATPR